MSGMGKLLQVLTPVLVSIAALFVSAASVFVSWSSYKDSHTVEQHTATSKYAEVSATRSQFHEKARHSHGHWTDTVSGAGFNGDSLVYVYYPSRYDHQAQPSNISALHNDRRCPTLGSPARITNGSFISNGIPIDKKLSAGIYYLEVEGASSRKEKFIPIQVQIGDNPPAAPLRGPPSGCRNNLWPSGQLGD